MITDLDQIRVKWQEEQPTYQELVDFVKSDLEAMLAKNGLYARVTGRAKDLTSLLKKAIRKSLAYEQIGDKAGVRVTVQCSSDIVTVDSAIMERYHVDEANRDDKSQRLETNQFDYRGIHYDILMRNLADFVVPSGLEGLRCEVQLRTLCQDVWSEHSHRLSYKAGVEIPPHIRRSINCLSALLEMADLTFESLSDEVKGLPGMQERSILSELEKRYLQLVGARYDDALSEIVIRLLLPLYGSDDPEAVTSAVDRFLEKRRDKLSDILERDKDRILFMSQPEILMILDRLEADHYRLEQIWASQLPMDELQLIATAWGKPLS